MEVSEKGKMKIDFVSNYSDFFHNYILIELPEDAIYWIAGGAIRDFYLYGYIKGGTDIDIFTDNQENFNKITKELNNYYDKKKESDFAITFTDKDDEEKVVQVIKKFYKSAQECIQNFDLTCCCSYISKHGDGIMFDAAEEFYDDNYNKKLRLVKLNEHPTCTFGRIQKYIKKGYTIEDGELLAMAKCYLEGDTDFATLSEEYTGLKLISKHKSVSSWTNKLIKK